jgi:hypothetical protein
VTDSRPPVDGPARLLAVVYGIFAISAGARSAYQIVTDFSAAPLAYTLSAVAALIYLLAALCFWRPSGRSWEVAVAALAVELAGVVLVGLLSVARDDLFPDQTVWSGFGVGYGFVPLILPIVGLLWLARDSTRRQFRGAPAADAPAP